MTKKLNTVLLCIACVTIFGMVNINADEVFPDAQAATPVVVPQEVTPPSGITPQQQVANKDTWGDKLILYFPNRVMDALDMVDISLGFGPVLKAKAWTTRYCAFGGGIGGSAKVIKGYNRQYGAGLESGWNASFMMLSAENTEMTNTTRDVQQYFCYYEGIPSLNNSVYNFWKGPKDMFSIGAEGAAFVELDAEVHPFEIVDFAAGIFFLDPKGDDLTMADFK